MKRLRAFFFVSVVFVGAPVYAATFHVAMSTPGASDSNDGLSPSFESGRRGPWKTLSKAGAEAQSGDTVLVYAGDYRQEDVGWGVGTIPLQNSGTEEEPSQLFLSHKQLAMPLPYETVLS